MTHWALLLATLLSLPAPPPAADVAGLSSADPRERERAARTLAGEADVEGLASLARAVAATPAPRPPGVEAAVRQAVGYAHLKAARRAWLAEHLGRPDAEVTAIAGWPFLGVSGATVRGGEGALIDEALPGFPASTALRGGDTIVWVAVEGGGSMPTEDFGAMTAALESSRPGQRVRLTVLRGGRAERVEVELAGRVHTDDPTWHRAAAEARREAGRAWDRDFAPLFAPPRPTTRPGDDPV